MFVYMCVRVCLCVRLQFEGVPLNLPHYAQSARQCLKRPAGKKRI